jgi:hypothetical protein
MPAKRMPTPDHPLVEHDRDGRMLMQYQWYDFFAQVGQPATLIDALNDAAAKAAGVPLYGLYRTGSTVKVRMT